MSNYKFLIVMTTIYNTKEFRISLKRLVNSVDPQDKILLVEDGLHPEAACREYASQFEDVEYLKFNEHPSLTEMIDRALATQDWQSYDYILIVHNDIAYSAGWRGWLTSAIGKLIDRKLQHKCPLINMAYIEFAFGQLDFPEDIDWTDLWHLLIPYRIYKTEVPYFGFGLGQDRWNMARTGRTSPILAIQKEFLQSRGGFAIDEIEYDLSMMLEASQTKKWNLWIDALGVHHFRPTESGNDTVLKFKHGMGHTHYDFMKVIESNFQSRYGFGIEDWFNKEFGEVKVKHKQQIERVFNDPDGDISTLDFVFDEIWNDNRLRISTRDAGSMPNFS